MNNFPQVITALFIAMVTLSGCAGNNELITASRTSSRQDVFQVIEAGRAEPGKAVLAIRFSVKNYRTRVVTRYLKHTDPPYTTVVNIDGQAIELTDEPNLEELPWDFKDNPEAGTGWRYHFGTVVALQPGKHRVTVAVPLTDTIVENELDLAPGDNVLTLAPLYRNSAVRDTHLQKFSNGLAAISMRLNGREL